MSGLISGLRPTVQWAAALLTLYPSTEYLVSILISQDLSSGKPSCSFVAGWSLCLPCFLLHVYQYLEKGSFRTALGHLSVGEGFCLEGWLKSGCLGVFSESAWGLCLNFSLTICFQVLERRCWFRVCGRVHCVCLCLKDFFSICAFWDLCLCHCLSGSLGEGLWTWDQTDWSLEHHSCLGSQNSVWV